MILRVLRLTGVQQIDYPPGLWLSIDRRAADLQDRVSSDPGIWRRCALLTVDS